MKRIAVIMLACLCAVASLATEPKPAVKNGSDRVSVKEAERLVAAWLKAHSEEYGLAPGLELQDITPPNVRDRLHAQVFEVRDRAARKPPHIGQAVFYLVKDRNAYPVGFSNGDEDLQTLVADIDGDSKDDLLFHYTWFGGVCYSRIGCYLFNGPQPRYAPATFSLLLAGMTLKTRGKHAVDAYIDKLDPAGKSGQWLLGEFTLVRQGKQEVLDIKLDPNLPKWCKDAVYRIPPAKAKDE